MLQNYNMSFTTGGLFYIDSLKALELYRSLMDWETVRDRLVSENLLQARTQSSAVRISREICQRLATLTEKQLMLLESGSPQEQRYLLWVAVCKRYPFIRKFMGDAVRERFLKLDMQISPTDFDIFFAEKAESNAQLERLSPSTRAKLRQVLFKIMREAEIIAKDRRLLPALPRRAVIEALVEDDPTLLSVFPLSDMDIEECLRRP